MSRKFCLQSCFFSAVACCYLHLFHSSAAYVSYSKDGRYLVSRDYLTVKIWDVNMETKPVKTISLHDYLRPMLYDLFTSDIIFDKFEVCCSPDGKRFASGSYRCGLRVMWLHFSSFSLLFEFCFDNFLSITT